MTTFLAAGQLVALPVSDATGLQRELAGVTHATTGALPPETRAFADAVHAEAARMGIV